MSSIPTISRQHVMAAIEQIEREGVPSRRQATKFALVVKGKRYPPKYVLSLAAQYAVGRQLRPDEFAGGEQTNAVLRGLGFTIHGPGQPARPKGRTQGRKAHASRSAEAKHPVREPPSKPALEPKPVRQAKVAPLASASPGQGLIARVVLKGGPATRKPRRRHCSRLWASGGPPR